jgi:LmbE family N-acetylglucosaminyl deacetylase
MLGLEEKISRVLVIAPHADDEVLGCGGTIARLAEWGCSITVLVMACGGIRHRHLPLQTSLQDRVVEFTASCNVLGISPAPILYPEMDMALDTIPQTKLVERLDIEIERLEPQMVLLPQSDANGDHHATYTAAMAALRPGAHRCVRQALAYETTVGFWSGSANMHWLYVDITDQLERKIAALKCYRSQLRPLPHPASLEAVRHRAQVAGLECGTSAAERFKVLRIVI